MTGVAAVPGYVGDRQSEFAATPPGHRFGLYFPLWDSRTWSITGKNRGSKQQALAAVLSLGSDAAQQLENLLHRQRALAERAGTLTIEAVSTAPFMTGIGMEHPLENGFAFLNPYGLPYLPGASIKGVLRRAAETLALDPDIEDQSGWDISLVWALFGFDATAAYLIDEASEEPAWLRQSLDRLDPEVAPWYARLAGEADRQPAPWIEGLIGRTGDAGETRRTIHTQGLLAFWDVFPDPAGGRLAIDILTPHYGPYYQKDKPPADCFQPTPIPFLTVPPKSRFRFHVQFRGRPGLPAALGERWRSLIEAAFHRAFVWQGFGAKTAVGYGQLRRLDGEGGVATRDIAAAPRPAPPPALPPPGTIVDGVLLEEKTKKGGWKARDKGSGGIGPILNSHAVPSDAQPDDDVKLIIASRTDFRWPTEDELARAARAPLRAQGPGGGHGQRRGPRGRGR